MRSITGHNYRTRKAYRRMNQKIMKDLKAKSSQEIFNDLARRGPSQFEHFALPEVTRLQMSKHKAKRLFWRPIDWFTDLIGYAVWSPAKGIKE